MSKKEEEGNHKYSAKSCLKNIVFKIGAGMKIGQSLSRYF